MFRLKILSVALIILTLLIGISCSKGGESPAPHTSFAGDIEYKDGENLKVSDDMEDLNLLLGHVLYEELTYLSKTAPELTDEQGRNQVVLIKKRFASSVKSGFSLDRTKYDEIRAQASARLYMTYQTDEELRTAYEEKYDEYSDDLFSGVAFGIGFEKYVIICCQLEAVSAYLENVSGEKLKELTDSDAINYLSSHEREFSYLEAVLILTARSPEDLDGALSLGNELADMINGKEDRNKAAEEALLEREDWSEESGMITLNRVVEYSGISGILVREADNRLNRAFSLEYGGNVYVAYIREVSAGAVQAGEETIRAIKVKLAEELALASVPDIELTVSWRV